MTEVAAAQSVLPDSREAGAELATAILAGLNGRSPDALAVFVSPQHNYTALLESVQDHCTPGVLVGASSAGEFTSGMLREGSASAFALRSDSMTFSGAITPSLSAGIDCAASSLVSSFRGLHDNEYPYRYALILADALAGYTDEFIDHLTRLTGGTYGFFGGGAADDARFQTTHVFLGTAAVSDAAVALEILSTKPLGIGARHGWHPTSDMMRITEAEGMRVVSLNAVPAADVMEEHAVRTGQSFDRDDPIPYFLHNTLGVRSRDEFKVRVPLAAQADGSLLCASDSPRGALACVMGTDEPAAANAAVAAAEDALRQLDSARPAGALFFDCVATRLRIGKEFGRELDSVQDVLGEIPMAGCNTYGQIVRSDGQFSGFHNCTAVVCVIPD